MNSDQRAFALAGAGIALGILVVFYVGGAFQASPQGLYNSALKSPVFYRPVMARMYSFNQWALPSTETPMTVGQAIGKMNASFVSGLIRLEAGATVSPQMLADFNTVRNIVLTASHKTIPAACNLAVAPVVCAYSSPFFPKFDIWFRADKLNYDPNLMVGAMQGVLASGMPVDAFSFDNLGNVPVSALQTVITFAHNNGKMLGGDCGSSLDHTGKNCAGLDYITTEDDLQNGFSTTNPFTTVPLNATRLAWLASLNIPVLIHLDNGPVPVDNLIPVNTFHSDFVNVFSDPQRSNYISFLAGQQSNLGYALMYPVFWPVGQVGPPSIYWDSPSDDSMLTMMQSLAAQDNVHP